MHSNNDTTDLLRLSIFLDSKPYKKDLEVIFWNFILHAHRTLYRNLCNLMNCAALTKQHLCSSGFKVLATWNHAPSWILFEFAIFLYLFFNITECCRFKKDLREITQQTDAKNRRRTPKYEYLNPKFVPNAISI